MCFKDRMWQMEAKPSATSVTFKQELHDKNSRNGFVPFPLPKQPTCAPCCTHCTHAMQPGISSATDRIFRWKTIVYLARHPKANGNNGRKFPVREKTCKTTGCVPESPFPFRLRTNSVHHSTIPPSIAHKVGHNQEEYNLFYPLLLHKGNDGFPYDQSASPSDCLSR